MDLSSNKLKESSSDLSEEQEDHLSALRNDYKPKDLCVKPNMKRLKPIPPPLNLISESSPDVPVPSALKEFAILATGPHSPLMQKNLPFRKRAHSVPDAVENAPLSAPPTIVTSFQIPPMQEALADDDRDSNPPLNLSLPATPKLLTSCDGSSLYPLIHHPVPLSPRPTAVDGLHHGASPVHQAYLRHHGQPWSPFLTSPSVLMPHWANGPPSALLSPASSSIGSSQEDLRLSHTATHSMPVLSLPPGVPHPHTTCEADLWRYPWPQPVWHCFQYGTLIRLSLNGSEFTARAEEIHRCSELKNLTPERIGSVCVQAIEPQDGGTGSVDIKFSGVYQGFAGEIQLIATCHLNQTFFVIEKGWCAVSPDAVYRHYGIQCPPIECGDYCPLLPKYPPVSSPGICDKFKRFSFSPEELSSSHQQPPGPYILSPPSTPTQKSQSSQHQTSTQYAKQPKNSKQKSSGAQSSGQRGQRTSQKSGGKAPLDPDRPKRPMNAFMLFAKQHRLKLIQMHPGKDNRFVSVILGEAWRQLPDDQKQVFTNEAKALSQERKRLHPECWKRKRSQSTS